MSWSVVLSGGSQINEPELLSIMGYTIGERNVLDILQFDWLKDNIYLLSLLTLKVIVLPKYFAHKNLIMIIMVEAFKAFPRLD